jgi:hypothetical protein
MMADEGHDAMVGAVSMGFGQPEQQKTIERGGAEEGVTAVVLLGK